MLRGRGWVVEAVIEAVLKPGVYRARLANGHRLVAFVAGRAKRTATAHAAGDCVRVFVPAYDLSAGRIVNGRPENNEAQERKDL